MQNTNCLMNLNQTSIIFDEEEYGALLYYLMYSETLKPKIYTIKELTVLAKYIRWVLKKSEAEVKQDIIKFCNINFIGFDPDINYQEINQVMINTYQTEIRQNNSVPITDAEWNTINKIKNDKARKILYVMLMIGKFNRINPIVYENKEEVAYSDSRIRCNLPKKELCKLAKVRFTKDESFFDIYKEYIAQGVLDLIPSNRLKHVLNFGNLSPKPSEIIFVLKHMSDLMLGYEFLNKQKIVKECPKCTHLFEDVSKQHNQLYCRNCKKQLSEADKKKEEQILKKRNDYKDIIKQNDIKQFTCIDCGEVFGKNKYNGNTKRCKSCQSKVEHKYASIVLRHCEDCNKEFFISTKSRRKKCDDCYKKYIKNKDKIRKQHKKR